MTASIVSEPLNCHHFFLIHHCGHFQGIKSFKQAIDLGTNICDTSLQCENEEDRVHQDIIEYNKRCWKTVEYDMFEKMESIIIT